MIPGRQRTVRSSSVTARCSMSSFPARADAIRRWLRVPAGVLRGVCWFVSAESCHDWYARHSRVEDPRRRRARCASGMASTERTGRRRPGVTYESREDSMRERMAQRRRDSAARRSGAGRLLERDARRRRRVRCARSCRPAAPGRRGRRGPAARARSTPAAPRWTETTRRRRAVGGVGSADEHRVDREAHEHHVDAVAVGQPQAGVRRQRRPAHQAHELGPQARRRPRAASASTVPRVTLRATSAVARASGVGVRGQIVRFWTIRMMAGPRMTMNSDGKMHPTSGNSILIGALAASPRPAGGARCGAARTGPGAPWRSTRPAARPG